MFIRFFFYSEGEIWKLRSDLWISTNKQGIEKIFIISFKEQNVYNVVSLGSGWLAIDSK